MRYALAADQMRAVEHRVVAEGRATLGELMERAGAALAAEVERQTTCAVAVFCGPGNNGGDGWVTARILHDHGRTVRVVSLKDPAALPPDARAAAEAAIACGVGWDIAGAPDVIPSALASSGLVVDAVFGFGFHGPATGVAADVLKALAAADVPVASADVPSGVDSDTGAVTGPAVRATFTVTFSALKPGLLIYPGADHAGEIIVADIGIPAGEMAVPGVFELPGADDLRVVLPSPRPDDHKGSRGRVAVVAGSRAYAGAAILALEGALRMGAGYVIAVVPEQVAEVVRLLLPNVIVREQPSSAGGALEDTGAVVAALADADAVVMGPGLTTDPGIAGIVHAVLDRVNIPVSLDADALNVLSADLTPLRARHAPVVLTPHPGEAARLLGMAVDAVQADRPAAAARLGCGQAVCLLKGPRTLVVGGNRRAIVRAGNPGLARAGSGDVLSGMIGALLAQRVPAFDAAVLAAHLHGRAADLGARELTETCFTASDITTFLPGAVREVQGG